MTDNKYRIIFTEHLGHEYFRAQVMSASNAEYELWEDLCYDIYSDNGIGLGEHLCHSVGEAMKLIKKHKTQTKIVHEE